VNDPHAVSAASLAAKWVLWGVIGLDSPVTATLDHREQDVAQGNEMHEFPSDQHFQADTGHQISDLAFYGLLDFTTSVTIVRSLNLFHFLACPAEWHPQATKIEPGQPAGEEYHAFLEVRVPGKS
jgi:hypothetical protein